MFKKSSLVMAVALCGVNTAEAGGWLLVIESPFSVARRVTCGVTHIVGDAVHLVGDVAVGAKDVVVYGANGVVHTVKRAPRVVHDLFCPCNRCRINHRRRHGIFRVRPIRLRNPRPDDIKFIR
jgi:hypothetical protein